MQTNSAVIPPTDGELLSRYCNDQDQQAFAEVVQRYSDMVYRVCRQVIGEQNAAADASQNVFMALSMKASELQRWPSVQSWLYRVAWNISAKSRRAACIRKTHEHSTAADSRCAAVDQHEPDAVVILKEALAELTPIYREAIELHYFRGYTTAQAAAHLRCPSGTIAARVSRGLEQLRSKLAARDLVISAVVMKVILLGMASNVRAAPVVKVPAGRGGPPRWRPGTRRIPNARFFRRLPLIGIFVPLFSLPAWAKAVGELSSWPARWWRFSVKSPFEHLRPFEQFLKLLHSGPKLSKPAAFVMLGLSCAAAGKAVQILHPSLGSDILKLVTPDRSNANQKADHEITGGYKPLEGAPAPAGSAVPEPGSISVLLGGGAMLLGGRRKRVRQR